MTDDYNGWTSYATWNVNLWIDNEYSVYCAKRDMLAKRKRPVTADTVRTFYHNEMGGTTPDLDEMRRTKERFGRINYREIAEHWETQRQEMLEHPEYT